jgi:hypothetical protein
VKRRDLEAHLARHDCHLLREGSRHSMFAHAITKKTSSVPRHTEIKNALAKDLQGSWDP